jgi:hypothetical protein
MARAARVALVCAVALSGFGCVSLEHGWTMPEYAGRVLPLSEPDGQRRLELETGHDPTVAWYVRTRGRPDYLHVVDAKGLVLVYAHGDVAVTFRRTFTATSYEIAQGIPTGLLCQLSSDDQRSIARRRGETPCPRPPKGVRLGIGARLERVPMTAAQLEDPTVQAAIAACERLQPTVRECRHRLMLEEPRSRFERGEQLFANLGLYGLEEGRHYDVVFRLFAAAGDSKIWQRQLPFDVPAGLPLGGWIDLWAKFDISRDATAGPWRLEVVVNGRTELEQSVEIAAK